MERGLNFIMQNTTEMDVRSRKSARSACRFAAVALACGFAVVSAAPVSASFDSRPASQRSELRAPAKLEVTPAANPGAKEKAAKKKADREAKKAEAAAKKAAKKEHEAELAAAKHAKPSPSSSKSDDLNGIGSDDPLEGL
jgi:hypothetical protein